MQTPTKALLLLLISVLYNFSISLNCQTYQDYLGAGNDIGITVTTSNNYNQNSGINLINGTALVPDMYGASRFLSQASLGANYEDIELVNQIGIEEWLDDQLAMPASSYRNTYEDIYQKSYDKIGQAYGYDSYNIDRRGWDYVTYTFYEKILKEEDILRHKVAYALSQIFVVSIRVSAFSRRGEGLTDYYDILYQGAFENFHDVLKDVSLHPIMGNYLSHFQNRKADPAVGSLPDENYAREIMQLFTIGLFEMNNDGTYKLDGNGEQIPTYDISDIQEMAKVFTGLCGDKWNSHSDAYPDNTGSPGFNRGINAYDFTVPMVMYESYHETGQKRMIDGSILPAGQPGMKDVEDAIAVLFNHDNIAPFISIRLIQQLVKSNPSPEYIERIATVFNDNGLGEKGDLGAVVCAILIDPEARDCAWLSHPKSGRLRQPVERLTNLFTAFDVNSPSGDLWFNDNIFIFDDLEQSFLASPSVFNFFTPFYAESEFVAPNNMVSPEFQILTSTTAIRSINTIEDALKIRPFANKTAVILNINNDPVIGYNAGDTPFFDFTDEIALYNNNGVDAIIERFNVLLCNGQLSDGTRSIISNAITQAASDNTGYDAQDAINDALYYMMMSPDYMILK